MMTLLNDFRNGSGVMAGVCAVGRRRAIVLALTACGTIAVAHQLSAAPPATHRALSQHGATDATDEVFYPTGHRIASPSPAVAGGHATHDPLWAGYEAVPQHHPSFGGATCDCAADGKKRPSAIRRALGSMTSGFDRFIFGRKSHGGCGCTPAGGDVPCDAIGADHLVPMPGHRQPFVQPAPGRVKLSPMPHAVPGPVPVPRREPAPPASDPQSDPFADDQVSIGANPAVAQSGYYD